MPALFHQGGTTSSVALQQEVKFSVRQITMTDFLNKAAAKSPSLTLEVLITLFITSSISEQLSICVILQQGWESQGNSGTIPIISC